MINATDTIKQMMISPVRQIKARVELLNGSTLQNVFTYGDRLISFTIQRVGEGKFYGYGITQRLNVHLIDTNRELDITTANTIDIVYGAENEYLYTHPTFRVSEVHRDERTNKLSITAYDYLYQAANHTTDELNMPVNYTVETIGKAAAALIGLNFRFEGILEDDNPFYLYYPNGANLDGTETLRELFDAIAEATQTIYYVDNDLYLVFKRLDKDGTADYTIDKENYFTMDTDTNRRLKTVCHATELGDNVSASIDANGTTVYVRNNPFYEMRSDIANIIDAALNVVGGFTINQFDCEWRGNVLVEIGDKIGLIAKDGTTAYSYLTDDTITYDGSYKQVSRWSYKDDVESESNPTSLGDAIKQTYARVDKANKNIELVTIDVDTNAESISALALNTNNINASVSNIEKMASSSFNAIGEELTALTKKVEATMTEDEAKLIVSTELSKGANKVVTATGFTFDENGLTVSKSNSEMETTITENGMIVSKDGNAVLTANNAGVDAVNLHATTYLIIGTNSRFEDYGSNRTGCFWIGG